MIKNLFKALLVIIVFLAIFIPGHTRLEKLRERNQALEQELNKLKIDNQRLSQEKKRLELDPLYVEEVARRELEAAREGEVIYRFEE